LYELVPVKLRNVRIEPTVLSGPIVKGPGVEYQELLRKLPTMLTNFERVVGSVCVAKLEDWLMPLEQFRLRAAIYVKILNNS
jgi:hypothetical protein